MTNTVPLPFLQIPFQKEPRQPQSGSLKQREKVYVFATLAGTIITAVSQQVALSTIPLLGLILMQKANRDRLVLSQQKQQQTTVVMEESIGTLLSQIEQLKTEIEQRGSSQGYLTKTHLVPIITKLRQLQREDKAFKLRELGNINQAVESLQQQLNALTDQTQQLEHQLTFIQPAQPQPVAQVSQKQNRVAIFIDGANLYHSASQLGHEIDYAELLTLLNQKATSSQAFFYTGIDSSNQQQQRFLFRLKHLGYQIITKEVIKRADGSWKANLDVELALDMMALVDSYDIAILVSGDGDFAEVIERVQNLGKRVEVVSYRATTSQKLLALAQSYRDLASVTLPQKAA